MKSSKKTFPPAHNIIDKLKLFYNLPSDSSLAELLDIRPNTLAIWKVRNSIDLQRIVTHCPSLDLNWLVDESKDQLPPATLLGNIKVAPAIFDRYKKYYPINDDGYVYTVNIAELKRYPSHGHLKAFTSKLPVFKPPQSFGWEGIIRMFQCDTKQMEPGIESNSWAIGRYIEEPWNAIPAKRYIAITGKNTYWGRLKGVIDGNKEIMLYPDNPTFPCSSFSPHDLKELWVIDCHIQEERRT